MSLVDRNDWINTVVNAPDARLAASGSSNAGAINVVVALNPTDRSLLLYATAAGGTVALSSAVGATSGIDWAQFSTRDIGNDVTGKLVTIPVFGAIDGQVTLALANSGIPATWVVVAVPDEATMGAPATPTTVQQWNRAITVVDNAVPNGTTANILPAPPAANAWRIKSLGFAGGPSTVATQCRFVTHTGTRRLLAQTVAAGAFMNADITPDMVLNDGLDFVNVSGVTISAWVAYQTVVPQ